MGSGLIETTHLVREPGMLNLSRKTQAQFQLPRIDLTCKCTRACALVKRIARTSNLGFYPSLISKRLGGSLTTKARDDDDDLDLGGHSLWMEENELEERLKWECLVEYPEEYWDNRIGKLNPKSPDFKHKTTGEALWLSDVPESVAYLVRGIPLPLTKEEAWQAVLQAPEQYWDNRANKLNPKSPDFKHKSTGQALWLTDASDWIVEQLESRPAPAARPKPAGRDSLWESLLSDPGQFYDNRLTKMNPKAPDFKHKSSGEALWLNSAPKSVLERLI